MGICKSLPESTEDLLTMDSSGHKQTEILIKEDPSPIYDENKIIVIQALYRGHKVRKSLMTTLHSPETSAPTQVEQSKFCFDTNQLPDSDSTSILMKNGAIYKGEWKDGKANGKGKYSFQDSYVEGTWASNELQGEAIYVNGTETYKGQWLDSMFHGIGEYVYSDGRIYQGEWKKGLQHGMGKEIYNDRSIYEGKFKEGMKNGLGIIRLADGCVYEGEFENDQFHGYGSFIWPDRKMVFEGYWKNGTKHGNGTLLMEKRIKQDIYEYWSNKSFHLKNKWNYNHCHEANAWPYNMAFYYSIFSSHKKVNIIIRNQCMKFNMAFYYSIFSSHKQMVLPSEANL